MKKNIVTSAVRSLVSAVKLLFKKFSIHAETIKNMSDEEWAERFP